MKKKLSTPPIHNRITMGSKQQPISASFPCLENSHTNERTQKVVVTQFLKKMSILFGFHAVIVRTPPLPSVSRYDTTLMRILYGEEEGGGRRDGRRKAWHHTAMWTPIRTYYNTLCTYTLSPLLPWWIFPAKSDRRPWGAAPWWSLTISNVMLMCIYVKQIYKYYFSLHYKQ